MDSWVGKFRTLRMSSSNNNYLVACNFHIMYMFISPSSLHMCLIRYPQIPMGTMAAIFGYPPPPPAYATGDCGNQVFLICHSKSLVLTSTIGDNQKFRWPQQADLFISNPPDVPGFFPSGQRTFLKFFYYPTDNTLFCSTVKLRKLKCTR